MLSFIWIALFRYDSNGYSCIFVDWEIVLQVIPITISWKYRPLQPGSAVRSRNWCPYCDYLQPRNAGKLSPRTRWVVCICVPSHTACDFSLQVSSWWTLLNITRRKLMKHSPSTMILNISIGVTTQAFLMKYD